MLFQLCARNMILEFKGSYFLPTSSRFKECYKGAALYGPEFTFQLCENKNWYAFANLNYLKQKGRFLSLCDSTTLRLIPFVLGIKYFVPFRTCWADFYLGLGLQVAYLHQKSRNVCVTSKKTLWGFGGIGKIGTYIHLPRHFLLNFFCDYRFAWTPKDNFYGNRTTCLRTNISGVMFGAGLGYHF